jgi:hypothetical protein
VLDTDTTPAVSMLDAVIQNPIPADDDPTTPGNAPVQPDR